MINMRAAFINQLIKLAELDERIILLTGDLGYTVLESFAKLFPKRFYNMGVAEQNMIGVATGLAEAGYIPFVYSIATFASLRAYEFIRNGPVWHQLPVRIIGIGGGFEYGAEGLSHYALEDLGIMRLQPMMVLVPADHLQAKTMLRKTWNLPGPIYYRISKRSGEPIPNLRGRFGLGRLQVVCEGEKVLFLVTGPLARETLRATEKLSKKGVAAGVGIVSSIVPAPIKQLRQLMKKYKLIVTVEAHYVTGGIGSLVAEVIAEAQVRCKLIRCGVKSLPRADTGSEAYLWKVHKLSASALSRITIQALKGVK